MRPLANRVTDVSVFHKSKPRKRLGGWRSKVVTPEMIELRDRLGAMSEWVTATEVAAHTNLNVSTVTRFINGERPINSETMRKLNAVLGKLEPEANSRAELRQQCAKHSVRALAIASGLPYVTIWRFKKGLTRPSQPVQQQIKRAIQKQGKEKCMSVLEKLHELNHKEATETE